MTNDALAQLRAWLDDIGATRVRLRLGDLNKRLTVDYTLDALRLYEPAYTRIHHFGLSAQVYGVVGGRIQRIAVVDQPSYRTTPIRWQLVSGESDDLES